MLSQILATAFASLLLWRFIRYRLERTGLNNIPGPPSKSWWMGNFHEVRNTKAWEFHTMVAQKYGGIARINTFLGEKQLYVYDPKALQSIVIKDQNLFPKSRQSISTLGLILGEGLFAATGEKHRRQRKVLNPVFSINHMREMTPVFYGIAHKVHKLLNDIVEDDPQEIDILGYMSRMALELITQSGLGYSFDDLEPDTPEHPYARTIKGFSPVVSSLLFYTTYLLPSLIKIGSPKFRRALINLVPSRRVRKLRDMTDLMYNTSVMIYQEKKNAFEAGDEAVAAQIAQGKDIMSLLIRENMKSAEDDRMEEADVIAQISSLMFAAMDTTSGALSRILSVLADHPEVQNRLRREIRDAQEEHGEDIPYDVLVALPWLDAVCRETLRLYPPVSQLIRESNTTVALPLSKPIIGVDGREMHEVIVPPQTKVIVSIIGSNRNPKIWGPDAHEWKPERWLEGLPPKVSEARIPGVYSNLMTFYGGGRSCIGFKFSQLEMKVALVPLVGSFKYEPSKQDIFWEMTGISSPIVKGQIKPQLPIVMSKA